MHIIFYGAAGEVTGSKHLVEEQGSRILLDCGLTQGRESFDHQDQLPFDPRTIDAVIISHAHLDHVGLLPVLIKTGFDGRITSTSATKDLAELILLDAAHLQEQDAAYAARKRWPGYEAIQPLYVPDDIPAVMTHWDVLPYQFITPGWSSVAPGVQVKLYDAGHILGSAVIVLELHGHQLAYSGDLGRTNAPLLRDPDRIVETVPTLILESTYGARLHHPVDSVTGMLIDIITTTARRGGKIIVPAFSLGRTQEFVYLLHQLTDAGRLPRIPIVVDSPLASRITEVFARHQRNYDQHVASDFSQPNEDPLAFRNLSYTHTVEESKALNSQTGPLIIISASGMATGGRILHHLANNLADSRNTILFTGYQAARTLGRSLIEGAKQVHLHGQTITVRAQISVLNDLSAHADAAELERYAASVPGLKRVFLVHGEPDRAELLRQRFLVRHPAWLIDIPQHGETFEC